MFHFDCMAIYYILDKLENCLGTAWEDHIEDKYKYKPTDTEQVEGKVSGEHFD